MSKASDYVKKELAKLVRLEGKKSSIKMGDALELFSLFADRLVQKDGHKLIAAIVHWGVNRKVKTLAREAKHIKKKDGKHVVVISSKLRRKVK